METTEEKRTIEVASKELKVNSPLEVVHVSRLIIRIDGTLYLKSANAFAALVVL